MVKSGSDGFNKKRVLVTGASMGIGFAIARFLAKRGDGGEFSVVGTTRNISKLSKGLAKDCPFRFVSMDVTDNHSVKKGLVDAIDIMGGIDVLVNNAGISHLGPFEEMPDDQGRAIFETNFFGIVNTIRAVLPEMRKTGGGLIINVGSLAGVVGIPFQSFYASSKFALEGLTESIRMELFHQNIGVVLVEPGDIKTDIASHHLITEAKTDQYTKPYKNVVDVVRGNVKNAGPPEDVARVVYKVIKTRSPRIRYPAGKGAVSSYIALKLVPQRLREYILKGYYNLKKI
ncbi:MAG: SDR family oxidoreductase [Deltaproteobacteria bacterium]|uniref:SDR family oxidoreductase n=1 Tax=Candidatus Zymogenus saltonus TaxID=2844893 RepID=A0A9D8PN24_9DELT|nr:SDR family oxidoreductase [Candidatus Zymogenus saltonus]